MKCKVAACGRDVRYIAAQLCQMHYFRQMRYGTTDTVRRGKAKPRIETPNGYIRVYDPKHPLSLDGYVFEHRKVAYDARSGVVTTCERCKIVPITWQSCHVDHDDDDRKNNAPGNLVVCCRACNTMRGGYVRPTEILLTARGETKNTLQWSRDPRVTVTNTCIRMRMRRGASVEDALFMPSKTRPHVVVKRAPAKFKDGKRVLA